MDIELLKRKSTQADRALRRIHEFLPKSAHGLETDYSAQDIVYRNFQIAVQNCVDMANHIAASEGWQAPNSMRGIFDLLAQNKFINSATRNKLRNMVIVRNILVHDYTRIDHKKAFGTIERGLKVISQYCGRLISHKHEK